MGAPVRSNPAPKRPKIGPKKTEAQATVRTASVSKAGGNSGHGGDASTGAKLAAAAAGRGAASETAARAMEGAAEGGDIPGESHSGSGMELAEAIAEEGTVCYMCKVGGTLGGG